MKWTSAYRDARRGWIALGAFLSFATPTARFERGETAHFRRRVCALGLAAMIALSLCGTMAYADRYARGDSGNFSDANWIDLDQPAKEMPRKMGPPGAGDIADMTGGSGETITASGGSVDTVEGSSNFAVTGAFTAKSLNYTGAIMGAGTLTVKNVLGASPFVLTITGGNLVAGTMGENFLVNGGSLHVTTFSGKSGGVSNGGVVTLDNKQNELSFSLQSGGQFNVPSVKNTQHVSTSVSGAGSKLTVKEDLVENAGSLDITSGAAAEVGGDLQVYGAGGIGGAAHWSDAGTTVRVLGYLGIGGDSAESAVGVASGASIYAAHAEVGANSVGGTGFVELSGTGTAWESRRLGIGVFSNGTFQMTTGAQLLLSDDGTFGVGIASGVTGMLTADGSSTVIDARRAFVSIAQKPGSHATVILTNGAQFLVGPTTSIADAGAGEVDVRSGSKFFAYDVAGATADLTLGNEKSALGGIVVTGSGSAASFGTPVVIGKASGSTGGIGIGTQAVGSFATDVVVGGGGIGTFYLDSGAQVTMAGGSGVKFMIAHEKSANGAVTVTGSGTSFQTAAGSAIFVGEAGKGSFSASDGAAVQTDLVFVGDKKGANGSVTIDTSASWTQLGGSVFYVGVDQSTGKVTVQNSATLSIPAKLVVFAGGQIVLDQTGQIAIGSSGFGGGGTLRVGSDGELVGDGTVSGKLLLDNGGYISPNIVNKPGILTVNGDFQAKTGGTLDLHVGGNTPGKQFDQINVTGNATLGGTLDVTPLNNFTPPAGKAFPVISAASISGTFDQVIGADVTYTATGVMVTPTLQASTLTVDVNPAGPPAGGVVSAGFLGQSLRTVGFNYTVAATPAKGFVFNGWSGDATSGNPALTFTMKANMTLHANFVSNAFAPAVGAFAGLGTSAGATPPDGLLNLALTASGKFTAKFLLNGKPLAFTGTFLGDGSFSNQYVVSGHTLDVQLSVNLAGSDKLSGSIAVDGVSYTVGADRATFSTKNQATAYAGAYTIYFPPNATNSDPNAPRPQGNCWATASISTAGAVKIKGALADNTTLSASGFLAKDGSFPLFESLYGGQGLFAGALTFAAAPRNPSTSVSDVIGTIEWSKPVDYKPGAFFPNPFDTTVAATGSFYAPPNAGNPRVLSDADDNATLQFTGGDLATDPTTKAITISAQNKVGYPHPTSAADKLTMTLTTATGAFAGKFYDGSMLVPFSGAVLQKQTEGDGVFPGASDSGTVKLSRSPSGDSSFGIFRP